MAANGRRLINDIQNGLQLMETKIVTFQHMLDYAPGVNNWDMGRTLTIREDLAHVKKALNEIDSLMSLESQELEGRGIMISGPTYEDTRAQDL